LLEVPDTYLFTIIALPPNYFNDPGFAGKTKKIRRTLLKARTFTDFHSYIIITEKNLTSLDDEQVEAEETRPVIRKERWKK